MIPPVYKLSDAKEERRRSIQNEKDKETELYLRSATPSMPIKSEIRRFPGFGLTRFIPAVANMNGRALETYKVQTEQQNIMNELFKQKETSKSGKNNTVDVTVSVMDIDYIDPVDGSFFCAFHTTCMYQFIVESQKRFKVRHIHTYIFYTYLNILCIYVCTYVTCMHWRRRWTMISMFLCLIVRRK